MGLANASYKRVFDAYVQPFAFKGVVDCSGLYRSSFIQRKNNNVAEACL